MLQKEIDDLREQLGTVSQTPSWGRGGNRGESGGRDRCQHLGAGAPRGAGL